MGVNTSTAIIGDLRIVLNALPGAGGAARATRRFAGRPVATYYSYRQACSRLGRHHAGDGSHGGGSGPPGRGTLKSWRIELTSRRSRFPPVAERMPAMADCYGGIAHRPDGLRRFAARPLVQAWRRSTRAARAAGTGTPLTPRRRRAGPPPERDRIGGPPSKRYARSPARKHATTEPSATPITISLHPSPRSVEGCHDAAHHGLAAGNLLYAGPDRQRQHAVETDQRQRRRDH